MNFPTYIRNTATDYYNELLNELNQRNSYKRRGSTLYYALHLRYASLQANRLLLLQRSSMLSLQLLNNIQQGGVDALKALKTLYENAPFLVTIF